jgi:hypothetical protein
MKKNLKIRVLQFEEKRIFFTALIWLVPQLSISKMTCRA